MGPAAIAGKRATQWGCRHCLSADNTDNTYLAYLSRLGMRPGRSTSTIRAARLWHNFMLATDHVGKLVRAL
jgi:hypothetical protein